MRIMGIDPGIAIVGFGILDQKGNQLKPVEYGSIQTEAGLSTATRLKQIYDACTKLFAEHRPDVVAIEKLFFNRNVTTAFTVGQARGVMMLAAEEANIPITEYTPLQVKMAVVGYGQAEKKQVQEMVKVLLGLPRVPKPDDVADALAIAICEAHSSSVIHKWSKWGAKR
ncbi:MULTISPECIES: crossover junction endodeoxyribonuclease RuvC [Thermoactinomyces]|jgi:crossover junction endodeoxyribonuclease RuvC|uniref:Crossover junction endodeoxyribonuclease RuvC n=1 Tax=Thermoactinomyces daqus TaxID=1329516 RepID=A0A7W1X792_9BACL|nr:MULTISPECIES: crossover junction endodeoxyribonuclease RuvC [Thermoactinomyces]MBA4541358.1 crossover junction endodeoxyribonuclease RuvC [Thermoactinomyces daqus]MBH8596831.1 crossover junction endodeoxyribonuclease RuvC [Thermoactinomyces sp. CICC 10523]MBH8603591.1 crossover junction endodeoxyribonuclease RuvC [Thermoactinomyces sp. CICC 10522]MBH8606756.1 crossover junction endodeoxyribonuclease RuvC [Thermoactinomyces sp. CICC 10521]